MVYFCVWEIQYRSVTGINIPTNFIVTNVEIIPGTFFPTVFYSRDKLAFPFYRSWRAAVNFLPPYFLHSGCQPVRNRFYGFRDDTKHDRKQLSSTCYGSLASLGYFAGLLIHLTFLLDKCNILVMYTVWIFSDNRGLVMSNVSRQSRCKVSSLYAALYFAVHSLTNIKAETVWNFKLSFTQFSLHSESIQSTEKWPETSQSF